MPTARALGTVAAVHDYGAGASLEIARTARRCWCRSPRACVPEVDIAGGRSSSSRRMKSTGARRDRPRHRPCARAIERATRHDLARLRPDAVPGDVPRAARPFAGRPGAGSRASGRWTRVNIRDFATDRHRTVDDTPFGGGAGMVLRPDVVDAAIASVADDRPLVLPDAARPAAHPGATSRALRRRARASSCCAAATRASISASSRRAAWRKSASATTCCRAANWRRWCCWTPRCGCCPA